MRSPSLSITKLNIVLMFNGSGLWQLIHDIAFDIRSIVTSTQEC